MGHINMAYHKVKIKLSSRQSILIFILLVILASLLAYHLYFPKPITTWSFYGHTLVFRAGLREADRIPVYPNEAAIYNDVMHPLVKNVTIAFKDAGESENPYYILEEIELANKLIMAYHYKFGERPGFNAMPVESYENLPGKIQNPIIALVHPLYSDETAIRNEGHVTFIKAKNYKDFDLATIKFLMIALRLELGD